MITRDDVIRNARRYVTIQNWSPLVDEHVFSATNPDHTFHSIYRRNVQYDSFPYCYGGNDSVTGFLNRIQNSTCPGGRDRCPQGAHTFSRRGTKHWYDPPPRGLGYGYRVPRNLAGIDCSAFVSRCWGIRRRTTTTLPQICLEIGRSELKRGDILNRRGSHVRIFEGWRGTRVRIYEASGSYGRVMHHDIEWDDRYTPYTPFPQFRILRPVEGNVVVPDDSLEVEIRGSGNVDVISMTFGNVCVYPRISGENPLRISYTPEHTLTPGQYELTIKAVNRVAEQSFVDKERWVFFVEQ
ncbi:MAG: hypothetical protein GXO66_05235 [Euryarchaeota archaeon]|nr:hypothetical protein [Euryarchaeota archaeon]